MSKKLSLSLAGGLILGILAGVFIAWGVFSLTTKVYARDINGKQPSAGAANFEFRTGSTNSGERVIIRFNPRTGESWINSTVNIPEWSKVQEKALPDGDYEVFIQKCRDTKNDYFVTRVDAKSGKAWHLGDTWVEFKEPK